MVYRAETLLTGRRVSFVIRDRAKKVILHGLKT